MKIKMLKQKKASGIVLEVDQIIGDEISLNDRKILVQMGSAERVVEDIPDAPAAVVKYDGKTTNDDLKAALDGLNIDHKSAKNKKELLALIPEELKK